MNITRVWHGIIRRVDAEAYKKYVEETGIKNYLNTEGNVSAKILLKYENKICHIITVSEWESLEDIKKFAGEDYKKQDILKKTSVFFWNLKNLLSIMKLTIMTEIEKIIERFKRAHYGTCWTGESYENILSNVNLKKVNEQILGFNNTIHQVVRHLITTDELIVERLNGHNVEFSQEKNWPDKNKLKEISWTDTLKDVDFYRKQVIEEILKMKDENLEEVPFDNFSPWYVQLNGLIEHLHYHMAQINLITLFQKKLQLTWVLQKQG